MYEITYQKVKTIWDKPATMAYRRNTNDRGVISSVMFYDEYQAKTLNYGDGDVFIDLGSHIGTYAVLMAMKNPTFKVYAVEPILENHALLLKNLSLNSLENVKVYLAAISDTSQGKEKIYYTDDSTDFGKVHKFIGSMQGGAGTEISINKLSLNDIFEKNKIEKCKVIKTDAEGGEVKCFKTLKPEHFRKIEYVVGEFHPWGIDFNEFFDYFEPHGFIDVSPPKWNTPPTSLRDFMFMRAE